MRAIATFALSETARSAAMKATSTHTQPESRIIVRGKISIFLALKKEGEKDTTCDTPITQKRKEEEE